MKRVIQEDQTGCGIACIAMLAARTYEDVRHSAVSELGFNEAGKFYMRTRDLKELGAIFDVHITAQRRRPFKGWESLPDKALVAINPREDNYYWHWVVFVRRNGPGFVLDPKPTVSTERRTDFGRMKPIWFLPVA